MKTQKLTIVLFFALIVLGTSCIGPPGHDGYDGRDGRDGEDGIANVGVAIYDVQPEDWVGDINGYVTTLEVPEITNYVYENGAVLVYMMRNEGTENQSFNQLPYTWLNNSITEYIDFDAYVGSLDITLRWIDNGVNNTEAPTGMYTFKILVIEGMPLSVLQTKVDLSNPELVLNTFSEVKYF